MTISEYTPRPTIGRVQVLWLTPALASLPLGAVRSMWDVWCLAFLILIKCGSRFEKRLRTWCLIAGFAIEGSFISAQIYNRTSIEAGAIGGAGWAAAAGTFFFFSLLWVRSGWPAVRVAVLALAVGLAAQSIIFQGLLNSSNPWKYGAGLYLTIIIIAGLQRQPPQALAIISLLLLTTGSLATASRFLGGIQILTVILLAVVSGAHKKGPRVSGADGRLILIAISLILVVATPLLSQTELAQPTVERFESGTRFNDNVLLGGRVEPPAEISGIADSPVFGQGIDGGIDPQVLAASIKLATKLGYKVDINMINWWFQGGSLYTHSVIATGWIQGGLVPGGLALLLVCLTLIALARASMSQAAGKIPAVSVFLQLLTIWNLVASPANYGALTITGVSAAMSYAAWRSREAGTYSGNSPSKDAFQRYFDSRRGR